MLRFRDLIQRNEERGEEEYEPDVDDGAGCAEVWEAMQRVRLDDE